MKPPALPAAERAGDSLPPALRAAEHALRQPLNAIGLFGEALRLQGVAQAPALHGLLEAVAALERALDAFFRDLPHLANALPRASGPSALPAAAVEGSKWPPPAASVSAEPALCVVLDDDPAARLGLSLLLEGWGLQVTALSGLGELEAWLGAADCRRPALVIADHHLPRAGEGLRAIDAVRLRWGWPQVPALLLTGDPSIHDPGPGVDLMLKPAGAARLHEWVQRGCSASAQLGA